MKSWWNVALGIVLGILSTGVILLASQPPKGNPVELLPPPTPIPIQVHILGEVKNPGVYALPIKSRVQDAINAAGGFTDRADRSGINLAEPLEDGISLHVLEIIQTETPETKSSLNDKDTNIRPTSKSITSQSQLININIADQVTLETLSGIGPVTAQKIIDFRNEFGPFTNINEIQKVSGIGPVTFEKIKDFITVDEKP